MEFQFQICIYYLLYFIGDQIAHEVDKVPKEISIVTETHYSL